MDQTEFEKQASEGETYTTPPAKSRVKLIKTSRSINWEVVCVHGTTHEEMQHLKNEAILIHNELNHIFPEPEPKNPVHKKTKDEPIQSIKEPEKINPEASNELKSSIKSTPWIRLD